MLKEIVGILVLSFGFIGQTKAISCDPAQFVGKIYSEALGRAPDPDGYNAQYNYIKNNSCIPVSVKNVARGIYLSSEFQSKTMLSGNSVDWAGRILAAYRGILNREPDSGGFSIFEQRLRTGLMTWGQFVNELVNSDEFSSLHSSIVAGAYSFGNVPVMQIKRYSSEETWRAQDRVVATDSQAVLQSYLNESNSGEVVYLAPKQVVRLYSPLRIPSGVTLKTWGDPLPGQYTKMGRLVRGSIFSSDQTELIILNGGATLQNVQIDGQRIYLGVGFKQGLMAV